MIHASTLIGHHRGELDCEAEVLDVRETTEGWEIVTDRTAFHPRNPRWPDQPADRGRVEVGGRTHPVVDVERRELPAGGLGVDTGHDDPRFSCVVHVVGAPAGTPMPAVGDRVRWSVDADHRRGVSRQHTAVHVMALALNRATAGCWTKPAPRTDSLGHPDVDALAIDSSDITAEGAIDVYRLGKSLRKKGFDASLLPEPDRLAAAMTDLVTDWIGHGGQVHVAAEDDHLDSRRLWRAELPGGTAEIPCGGSHAASLSELGGVSFEVTHDDDSLTVRTTARGRPAQG